MIDKSQYVNIVCNSVGKYVCNRRDHELEQWPCRTHVMCKDVYVYDHMSVYMYVHVRPCVCNTNIFSEENMSWHNAGHVEYINIVLNSNLCKVGNSHKFKVVKY